MCNPSATAIFVGGASLLHLPPKFCVTFTFTTTGTEFGNSAVVFTRVIQRTHNEPNTRD